MEEKTIIIDGILTNYKIGGKGETFLILHGWGGSSDSWKGVIEILHKKFKIVAPDFPGFGKSQMPQFPWSLDDFVSWLKKFVDALNLEKFYLLGHSFGGRVAVKFSIFFPDRIQKLFLVDAAGIKLKLGLKEKITLLLARLGNFIFSKRPLFYLKDVVRNKFYQLFRVRDYSKAKGVMKEIMKKVIAEDLFPELNKIQTETIIIWGEKDRILPKSQAFLFKSKIRNSKVEILKNLGHSPHLEDPEALAKVLLSNLP